MNGFVKNRLQLNLLSSLYSGSVELASKRNLIPGGKFQNSACQSSIIYLVSVQILSLGFITIFVLPGIM
jgi:hypothetical protein